MDVNFTTTATPEEITFYKWVNKWREQMARELAEFAIWWYVFLLFFFIAIYFLPIL